MHCGRVMTAVRRTVFWQHLGHSLVGNASQSKASKLEVTANA